MIGFGWLFPNKYGMFPCFPACWCLLHLGTWRKSTLHNSLMGLLSMCLLVILSCALLQDGNVFFLEGNPASRLFFWQVSLDWHNPCRWIHCSPSAIPVGCTSPRVPVPFPLHTSLLSCPRNDTLAGCYTALVLLQTLWVGKKEAEITSGGCWSKSKILSGKAMDFPSL